MARVVPAYLRMPTTRHIPTPIPTHHLGRYVMTKILEKRQVPYMFFFWASNCVFTISCVDSAQMHLLVAVTTPALLVLQQCVLSTLMCMRWVYRSLFQNCYWFSDSLSYYGGGGCYSPSNPSSYYTYGYELSAQVLVQSGAAISPHAATALAVAVPVHLQFWHGCACQPAGCITRHELHPCGVF